VSLILSHHGHAQGAARVRLLIERGVCLSEISNTLARTKAALRVIMVADATQSVAVPADKPENTRKR
jgi:hypothetical protein